MHIICVYIYIYDYICTCNYISARSIAFVSSQISAASIPGSPTLPPTGNSPGVPPHRSVALNPVRQDGKMWHLPLGCLFDMDLMWNVTKNGDLDS